MRAMFLILTTLAALTAAGCRRPADVTSPTDGGLRALCSFLPVYVFTLNIVGDAPGVQVQMLLPASAGCPHDYEVTARDIKRLSRADVLVVLGGIDNDIRRTAAAVGAGAAVVVAQAKSVDATQTHANPHVWVSPHRAVGLVRAICDGLCRADPARAEIYRRNTAAYAAKIERLADEVAALALTVRGRRVAVVHGVFDDLADDLGLNIVATIRSADGGLPSPRELHNVIRTIQSRHAVALFSEPQYPADLPEQIARQTGIICRELDPIAGAAGAVGPTYYEDRMHENLRTLAEVLAP
ncbi:MAG: metal ABC transporter substrate-binding protein [Phycisphaerae bacterium]